MDPHPGKCTHAILSAIITPKNGLALGIERWWGQGKATEIALHRKNLKGGRDFQIS